jgi:hypothetical protein
LLLTILFILLIKHTNSKGEAYLTLDDIPIVKRVIKYISDDEDENENIIKKKKKNLRDTIAKANRSRQQQTN